MKKICTYFVMVKFNNEKRIKVCLQAKRGFGAKLEQNSIKRLEESFASRHGCS